MPDRHSTVPSPFTAGTRARPVDGLVALAAPGCECIGECHEMIAVVDNRSNSAPPTFKDAPSRSRRAAIGPLRAFPDTDCIDVPVGHQAGLLRQWVRAGCGERLQRRSHPYQLGDGWGRDPRDRRPGLGRRAGRLVCRRRCSTRPCKANRYIDYISGAGYSRFPTARMLGHYVAHRPAGPVRNARERTARSLLPGAPHA